MQPLLIFGYGNPSRGDDAIGPLLIERLEAMNLPQVELMTDFQLQIENALDLRGREWVLFVDASYSCPAPFAMNRVQPLRDASYTSHTMSPAAVLHACFELYGERPECWLLEVKGDSFELGEELSTRAREYLILAYHEALKFCVKHVSPDLF